MRHITFKSKRTREATGKARLAKAGTRRAVLLTTLTLLLLAAISFVVAGAIGAPAAPNPPAPSITARPADPSNQTSAHFAYSDSQSGVSYQCQLDGGSFSACPAG